MQKRIQAEDQYQRFFEDAIEGIFQTTIDGRFINANPAFARMFGYSSPRELIDSVTDIGRQMYADPQARRRIIEMTIENNNVEGIELEVYRKDKSKFWILLNGNIVRDANGRMPYLQGMNIDITKRKRAEDALRESEEKYRQLVQNTTAIILRFDLQGRFIFINNYAQSFFGYTADELIGRKALGTIIPELESTGRDLSAMFDQIVADPDSFHTNSNENMRKTGERVWVEWTNSGIFDQEGVLREFLSVGIDITARKRAEVALKESENKYRTIFENTGSATVIVEEDMTISLANSEFEKVTGYSKTEVEGRTAWKKLIAPEYHQRLSSYHEMRRQGKKAPTRYESQIIDKNGRKRDVLITVDMIPGTKTSIASAMDITMMKNAEKELKKREHDLRERTMKMEDANAALRALLRDRDEHKTEIESAIYNNIKELVIPYLEKLRKSKIQDRDEIFGIISNNLKNISSPLSRNLKTMYSELTPKEIQVINMIREGMTSKDISEFLNVSTKAVEFHRDNIRRKLGMKNMKTNLFSFLLTLDKP